MIKLLPFDWILVSVVQMQNYYFTDSEQIESYEADFSDESKATYD